MSDDKSKARRKELLDKAIKDLPAAAVGYGLGYGIGRTAVEMMVDNPNSMPPALRNYLPPLVGAGVAYAGVQAGRALTEKPEAKKKR